MPGANVTGTESKVDWEGTVLSVQPRIRLSRSFDQRSHSAAIAKGKSICLPINFLRGSLDEFVTDVVTQRIATLLGESGRSTLLRIVEKEFGTEAHDPGPEIRPPEPAWTRSRRRSTR